MIEWVLGLLGYLAVWSLFYGSNIIWRLLLERRYRARHQVVAEFPIRHEPSQDSKQKRLDYRVLVFAGLITWGSGYGMTALGLVVGIALDMLVVTPLYKHSRTGRVETVYFDRQGVSFFPPRPGELHQGIFQARIEWKDVQGYSAHKGSLLFALCPLGHIEQRYGPYREPMERALDRLDVRKLVAFDVLDKWEATESMLSEVEQRVLAVAEDVVASYATDAVASGVRLEPKVLYSEESDGEDISYATASLHIGMWEGETCLREMEWLIWEQSDDMVELL
ncbi:MAG TPA: hypothetical protein VFV52_06535, partial [Bacilli bacterium]|nr:hypothetical protein [Bacilli bacterium]